MLHRLVITRYIAYEITCYIMICSIFFSACPSRKTTETKALGYYEARNFDFHQSCPREELHQFLIGLYGDYVIPSTLYEVEQVLRRPDLVLSKPGVKVPRYLVTNEMKAGVWARLRDRLSSLDSSFSMVEVTVDYATHFCDMYVDKQKGKHLSGERVRILLLALPFLLRDLIAPEVLSISQTI